MQNTSLDKLQKDIGQFLFGSLSGSWRKRSLSIISLLLGFYLGNNVTVYFLEKTGYRALVVLLMIIIIEFLIRLRAIFKNSPPPYWFFVENLRIGCIYAVVLEAFKLGS